MGTAEHDGLALVLPGAVYARAGDRVFAAKSWTGYVEGVYGSGFLIIRLATLSGAPTSGEHV